jgi:hypothetical protein
MTMTTLAAWSQIAASVAVLLTLVYLTIQVRQAAALMRAESRQALMVYTQQEIFKVIDRPDIQLSLADPHEPAPEAKVRLSNWLNAVMRAREHEWLQFKNGVLDADTWNSYKQVIPTILLGNRRARDWWATFGPGQFHPDFCRVVDNLIQDKPYSDYLTKVLAMH